MIKINKRPLPDGVTIKTENDYRSGIVFQMLTEDCYNKCYICEDSLHTATDVEHRVSHGNDPALKYDWHNLFLACRHCNNTKLDKYDGIIDPSNVDPEKFIKLSLDFDDELREIVVVSKVCGGNDVDITTNLLNAVYNGVNTAMKKYACQHLRNKLSNELVEFCKLLDAYKVNPSNDNKTAIKNRLHNSSICAAFKREMVRNDPELHKQLNAQ